MENLVYDERHIDSISSVTYYNKNEQESRKTTRNDDVNTQKFRSHCRSEILRVHDVSYTTRFVVIKSALSSVDHIFKESYEASYAACEDDKCLIWAFMGPHGIASGDRRTWCWIMRGLEGEFLHTLGFQVLVYHVTANVSDWYVDQVSVLYIVFY